MDKPKIEATLGRIILMLQQREFTAAETSALILCLQSLLDIQCEKHNIEPAGEYTNG